MLRHWFRMLPAVLVALAVGSPIFAAEGDKKAEGKPGAGAPNREAMLKKFDKNGDGKIDQAEMQAAKEAMGKRKPADGDKPGAGPEGRPSPERMKELMQKFDKNGDGKLDDAEKSAAKEAFLKMRGAGGKPGEGKPGDGKPGAGKLGAGKPGEGSQGREAMLKRFDKNGDGTLDDSEKAAAKEAFLKMRGAAGGKPGADKKPGDKKPE